jgi:hypothetical protein
MAKAGGQRSLRRCTFSIDHADFWRAWLLPPIVRQRTDIWSQKEPNLRYPPETTGLSGCSWLPHERILQSARKPSTTSSNRPPALPDLPKPLFGVLSMTRIVLKSDAAAVFEILKTAMGVLLYPTVIAFHESRGLIYVNDHCAEAVISRLKKADAPASLLVEPQDRRLGRSATYTRYCRTPFQVQRSQYSSTPQVEINRGALARPLVSDM